VTKATDSRKKRVYDTAVGNEATRFDRLCQARRRLSSRRVVRAGEGARNSLWTRPCLLHWPGSGERAASHRPFDFADRVNLGGDFWPDKLAPVFDRCNPEIIDPAAE